jgi:hypothetical protein
LLLELYNPRQCSRQLLLQLGNQSTDVGMLGPQAGVLFLKHHGRAYTTV